MVLKTATPEIIQEMVDRIVREFDPVQVILFGSQARGDAGPDSDVDLLVVMDDGLDDRPATEVEMARVVSDLPIAKDIFVTTPSMLARRGHIVNNVLYSALTEGRVVYARD